MPTLTLMKMDGSSAGSFELAESVFGCEKNAVVVREVFNAHMANQRQGNHSTKTRGFVSGGGAKPWKQKGTGRARQGSIRSPQWRHGAIVFGPLPRSYRQKVNKKKRALAFRSLLTSKFERGELIGLEAITFGAEAKTRDVVAMLAALGAGRKVLLVTAEKNEGLIRGASNLELVKVQVVNAVSIYELLICDHLIIEKAALAILQERLA